MLDVHVAGERLRHVGVGEQDERGQLFHIVRPRELSVGVGVLHHVDVQVLQVVVDGLEIAQDASVAIMRVAVEVHQNSAVVVVVHYERLQHFVVDLLDVVLLGQVRQPLQHRPRVRRVALVHVRNSRVEEEEGGHLFNAVLAGHVFVVGLDQVERRHVLDVVVDVVEHVERLFVDLLVVLVVEEHRDLRPLSDEPLHHLIGHHLHRVVPGHLVHDPLQNVIALGDIALVQVRHSLLEHNHGGEVFDAVVPRDSRLVVLDKEHSQPVQLVVDVLQSLDGLRAPLLSLFIEEHRDLLLLDDHPLEHLALHRLDVGALHPLPQPLEHEGGLFRVAGEKVRYLVLVINERGDVRRRYPVSGGRLRVRHLHTKYLKTCCGGHELENKCHLYESHPDPVAFIVNLL